MRTANRGIGLLALLLLAVPSSALGELKTVATVLPQPTSPVQITEFEAEFEGNRVNFWGTPQEARIKHELRYRNASDARIEAVRFTFLSYSVFNEYLVTSSRTAIEEVNPGDRKDKDFSLFGEEFYEFETGLAFVEKVRFENGDIWEFDAFTIVEGVRTLELEFDASLLEGSPVVDP